MILWIHFLFVFNYLSDDPSANIDRIRIEGFHFLMHVSFLLCFHCWTIFQKQILCDIGTVKEKMYHLCKNQFASSLKSTWILHLYKRISLSTDY